MLNVLEGHYISGYGDAEDRPDKELELLGAAPAEAEAFLADHLETRERFERVAALIEGFESAYGMELLATTHWVMAREGATDRREVLDRIYAWSERKKLFEPDHIEIARQRLLSEAWLPAAAG